MKDQPLTVIVEYPEYDASVERVVRGLEKLTIYVAIVFVLAYLLDSFQTKKDLEYINGQIKAKNVACK